MIRRTRVATKVVVVAAVAATAFICGWQSTGVATGLGMAAALGGGALAAVVSERDGRNTCTRLRRRRSSSTEI